MEDREEKRTQKDMGSLCSSFHLRTTVTNTRTSGQVETIPAHPLLTSSSLSKAGNYSSHGHGEDWLSAGWERLHGGGGSKKMERECIYNVYTWRGLLDSLVPRLLHGQRSCNSVRI